MVKMAIYTQKCEQKRLKINTRGGGGRNRDLLGGKKNRKINNRGAGEGGGDAYWGLESVFMVNFKRLKIL